MKTKKLSINIITLLSEFILQHRNSPFQQSVKKIETLQETINNMHRNNLYSKELYFDLIEKTQYSIEQKLNSKQNRLTKKFEVLIHFKLTEKTNSNISFIQSWIVSTEKLQRPLKIVKIDFNQDLIYLLQQVIRSMKCQFLSDFLNMSQQLRSKYIVDYQIQINSARKGMKQLNPFIYQNTWKKWALIDQQNLLTVTCYHSSNKKIKTLINQSRMQSKYPVIKLNIKHGSEETKPSNSQEFQLSTSVEQKDYYHRQRKTSLIEFYDQDLNITVLSNDSDSFKKSTGRIEGIYVNQNVMDQDPDKNQESDDEFQLLIEQSIGGDESRSSFKQSKKIKQIEFEYQNNLRSLDKIMQDFSI